MKILIPMAGAGSRFPSSRFPMPKPLIPINGEAMIVKAIKSLGLDGEYLFVLSENKYTPLLKESIESVVSKPQYASINYLTEGPACSALLFDFLIDNDEELVIANCDQIMTWNSEQFLINARMYDGCVVTYHNDHERNSYAKLDLNGMVTQIKEKEVISKVSLNGIHYWKKGKYFVQSAKEMIQQEDRADNGEFYVGPTYNYIIKEGLDVGIYHIPNEQHHAVGVPEDLERYLEYENS
jgi:NDP-sugar pyrophosphorylase family protein